MNTITQRPTPETDAAAFDIPHHGADGTGSRVAVVHYQAARKLERERDEAREALSGRTVSCSQRNEAAKQLEAMREAIKEAHKALLRLQTCEGSPDIDVSGEARFGLHCGVEDRDCQDRYDGADFGYSQGVEKTLEWAVNEAKAALAAFPLESLKIP